MSADILQKAINSVQHSDMSFCKFLSANDSGETNAHQSGILISKSAKDIMFDISLESKPILKRNVKIKWHDDFETDGVFTYYSSKRELRITGFGRGFPFLKPSQTGSLFVFTKQNKDNYSGYFLDDANEIDEFLNTFGISPSETNSLIKKNFLFGETAEQIAIENFISTLTVDFPPSSEMSAAARKIQNSVYDNEEFIISNPDKKIVDWTRVEYNLFRALEYARYKKFLQNGFQTMDDFVATANTVLNRRKSRAGKSLENHLAAIFDANKISYSSQPITEGSKKPDFLFPSETAYKDLSFPTDKIVSLAAKTTCKDRWRQILNEANRLKDKPKFLCTLQQGISLSQLKEMQSENVILVVPKYYINYFSKEAQDKIWTLKKFIDYIKEMEK